MVKANADNVRTDAVQAQEQNRLDNIVENDVLQPYLIHVYLHWYVFCLLMLPEDNKCHDTHCWF